LITHVARQGDCITSIAARYGTTLERIWDCPENAALRELRKEPSVLFPGDVVKIPREAKAEDAATGSSHTFKVSGQTARLKLQLLDGLHQPLKDVRYRLVAEGIDRSGSTDSEGKIVVPIPARLERAQLFWGEGAECLELQLGALDPVEELSGIQGRLHNLGFDPGPADGELGPRTQAALLAFQGTRSLQETGEPDDATRAALLQRHDWA
jgi:hypothetical protein